MWRLASLIVGLSITIIAHAEIYKWTDAQGVIHYSDAPPAEGARTIKLPPLSIIEGYGDVPQIPKLSNGGSGSVSTSSSSSSSSGTSSGSSSSPRKSSSY